MRLRVYIALFVAVVAGLLAAYETYRVTGASHPTHQTDSGKDTSPGPLF